MSEYTTGAEMSELLLELMPAPCTECGPAIMEASRLRNRYIRGIITKQETLDDYAEFFANCRVAKGLFEIEKIDDCGRVIITTE